MSKLLRLVWPVIIVLLGVAYVELRLAAQARDDAGTRLLGSWRVLSYKFEFQDGGERARPLGVRPNGYVILGSDGRMMAYLEASGRTPPRNDQERAEAYKTMNATAGVNQYIDKDGVARCQAIARQVAARVERPIESAD